MVGVYFTFICCISFLITVKCNVCSEVCSCLGGHVDCTTKNLRSIPPNLPEWSKQLYLNSNHIKDLNAAVWEKLTEIQELKLNKNEIEVIPKDVFVHQRHLKILELNRNKLTTIKGLTFKSLKCLDTLKLKKNEIHHLPDGAFFGLEHLYKLFLDHNKISSISKEWLYGLHNLKELSLSHNNLNKINVDAWEFCSGLVNLDLSYNFLESVQSDTFRHLRVVQKLNLNNNKLMFIDENAFNSLINLKTLYLNGNKLSTAIEDANGIFHNLTKLTKFHLANNEIKSVNKNAFSGLYSLILLDLTNNNITSIQENAFAEIPHLMELHLNTTSLLCDSNIRWFHNWIKNRKYNINTVCGFPPELKGKNLQEIKANELSSNELPKPKLLKNLDTDIMALKGENVSLHCTARSSSGANMTFSWKKDNNELDDSMFHNFIISSSSQKELDVDSVLNITLVQNSDAGKYQCIVSNQFGTAYSQKATISVMIFPTFLKIPSNITVKAGETAKLECSAQGEPQPEIAWHKDSGNNFPAASERRMFMMPTDDVFFITDVKLADMGIYSCTAQNAAGTIIANATLNVEQEPSFVNAMENMEINAGESVVFKCKAAGAPKPTIRWLKNGQPIIRTERHFFTAEDQLLIIVDTTQNDSGDYQCHLNNTLGQRTAFSRLTVKPSFLSSRDMWGIIIIAVVCCAVVTSLVWVVIIYQTRKHIASPRSPESSGAFSLPKLYTDDNSDKDSGTGDSAKRSSDDLAAEEFDLIVERPMYSIRETHTPLLHYSIPTNHDRSKIEIHESQVVSV
ncbi:leucine-rich repeats and immunoglobulin-like domains protein 3 [Coccinella septempunctata]|uniref:leucine-rich repeats and immunoglobulin-like domains protein 3 n=1 Tax=Coccinella septempunctata TaxID=41139 RepID=UPI001D08D258|nr:leucine-rich repeats and immunoglobulin-like domains protein 3 [Coccinella septempunctata]